ncbi:class I SAM-dependent methyltransferase [Aquibium oceanicum]|uniref:Methyltransferase domain-containing protein n=1 Tax=Aquibium oceanicum TaxID=1670800 RepID=A0A1L3SXV7_9HYPH|nr:class I SAM-dependent methyltransferase [Aquibium oceanicum]APH74273.1 hypothetical protein BSQ44_25085 [Aquibium oceanicum]
MKTEDEYLKMIKASEWNRTVPPWVENTFSMMRPPEKAMLWHLTKDFHRPLDCIVDAGCWTGASTLAFCLGIKDGGHPARSGMVASFDLFVADEHTRTIYLQRKGLDVKVGSSLIPIFLNNIYGHEDLISIVKGDLLDHSWSGRPIDILFLDLLKTKALNTQGSKIFFPHLRPQSIIIQQDYVFDHLPWIPLTMQMFRDHFEVVGYCLSSALFMVRSTPSESEVSERLAEMDEMPLEAKLVAFDEIISQMPHPVQRTQLELSRMWCALHYGGPDRARHELSLFEYDEKMNWVALKLRQLEHSIARAR